MDSEECPGTRGGGGAGGGSFTVAWKYLKQQLMECPGIVGGTRGQCQGQGPDRVTHPRLMSSPLGLSAA